MLSCCGRKPSESYVEIERWRRDGTHIAGMHERIWRHSGDGSGRISLRQLPVQPAKGSDTSQIGHTSFDHVSPIDFHVPTYWTSFAEQHGAPPSANPQELIRQLGAGSVGARFTLIFGSHHGHLLASQREIPRIVLDDYTLYLQRLRTDGLG